jgi:hypothetical protein
MRNRDKSLFLESALLTFKIVNFRRDFWHTVIASEGPQAQAKQSRRDAEIASSLRSSQ